MKYFCIYVLFGYGIVVYLVFVFFFLRFYNIEEINVLEVMLVIMNYKYYVKSLNRKKNDNYKKLVNYFFMVFIISFFISIFCGGLVMVGRTYIYFVGKFFFFLVRMYLSIY